MAKKRKPKEPNCADIQEWIDQQSVQRQERLRNTLEELRERATRLAKLLNRFAEIQIQQRAEDTFEIRPG